MYYDIISLFLNMDIFSANRHSESKVLCQNRDKEPLSEPETSFILRTRTNSDVSHCGVETGSDHGESIFTAGTSLRLPDVWWRRLIRHWKDYKCKSLRLICMCLSWSGHLRLYMNKRNETGGKNYHLHCHLQLIGAGKTCSSKLEAENFTNQTGNQKWDGVSNMSAVSMD